MFEKETYKNRRENLRNLLKEQKGVLLFIGNSNVAFNFPSNCYPFRQDSSFLYFFGIDEPDFAAVMDLDSEEEIIFADPQNKDDIIWEGEKEPPESLAQKSGIDRILPFGKLKDFVETILKQKRKIHFLPPYRHKTALLLQELLGINHKSLSSFASMDFIKSVAKLRLKKQQCEIDEIKKAIDIAKLMHKKAVELAEEGMPEKKIKAELLKIATQNNSVPAYEMIITSRGDIFHNTSCSGVLKKGDLLLVDAGVETEEHYASDITRTTAVGEFSQIQKEIYDIVLKANREATKALKSGTAFVDVHLKAARVIAEGLKALGFLKGSMDAIMETAAYALFFPHGVGHPLGLDVHDMESLGEEYVGYDERCRRSSLFGLSYLRFAKPVEENYVFTIEPGIYFNKHLIESWKNQSKHKDLINYENVEKLIGFGGIRIEDDVVVKKESSIVLSENIPK